VRNILDIYVLLQTQKC